MNRKIIKICYLKTRQEALSSGRVFKHITEVDTSSSYFFQLEKSHPQSKTKTNVQLPSGRVTDDPDEIKSHVRNFYRTLYTKVSTDESARDTLLSDLPSLDPVDSEDLDDQLLPEELDLAAKQLSNNKAPGLDGLSCEFYQCFWPLLKNDLLSVLNHAVACGSLPRSSQRGVISLIPKKGDLSDVANWRPVSLLNTDYKIFAKLLANRLKSRMHSVINHDQSYCVPDRSIHDNILLIKDIINCSN